jgi:hypothetical protein
MICGCLKLTPFHRSPLGEFLPPIGYIEPVSKPRTDIICDFPLERLGNFTRGMHLKSVPVIEGIALLGRPPLIVKQRQLPPNLVARVVGYMSLTG